MGKENSHALRRFEYSAALQIPDVMLQSGEEIAKAGVLPMEISKLRGQIPVLTHDSSVDCKNVAVIANCGALTYNSRAFVNPGLDSYLGGIIAYDRVAYAPRMLAYTLEDDEFVYESPDAIFSEAVLGKIRDSYAEVGVFLTNRFTAVNSVDAWAEQNKGRKPVAANAFDPLLLASFGRTENEADYLFQRGLVNAAAYTKKGATDLWQENGVLVPNTRYYDSARRGDVSGKIDQDFRDHERLVVSTSDGAGGDGIAFVSRQEAGSLIDSRFKGKEVQIQGLLPLVESPCVIANITPDGITPLLLSQQRFSAPGAHGGNVWDTDTESILTNLPSDFVAVNNKSLQVLAAAGVFGQVNVDSLVVSDETREKYGLAGNTLMREANIRPAGSSVILRMKEGNIDGKPISRIHTSAGIKVDPEVMLDHGFLNALNTFATDSQRAVLYGYDIQSSKASIAFLAAQGASAKDLELFEDMTTAMLTHKMVE